MGESKSRGGHLLQFLPGFALGVGGEQKLALPGVDLNMTIDITNFHFG